MNMEKIKYSKCPNCKKYGISALRGIGRASTSVVTCKYCGKKYRVNSALALVLTVFIIIIGCTVSIIITDLLKVRISGWILGILFGIFTLFSERYWPMEEEKDK